MNGDDDSPVKGNSSPVVYNTDRSSYERDQGIPTVSNSVKGPNVLGNKITVETSNRSSTENESLKFGTLPKQFVNHYCKVGSGNVSEPIEQSDPDSKATNYSNRPKQFIQTSHVVDSSNFMDTGMQMVPNYYHKEKEVSSYGTVSNQSSDASSSDCTESDRQITKEYSPESETLKFCKFVKQCTERSKRVDSPNLRERERQSENKDIRYNDIVQKLSRSSNNTSPYSLQSEKQDSEENETLKFGTFPKQIKVYKKCHINSLSSPGYSTGSLDRGGRHHSKGMRLHSESPCDDRSGNSTRGRAPVTDFYRHSRREIINTTARIEENECLREIIEDLRNTLQRRDAQCLALQVALQHAQAAYNSKRLNEDHYMRREPFVSVLYEEVSGDTDPNVDHRLSSPNRLGMGSYNYLVDETDATKTSESGDSLPSSSYSPAQSLTLNERGQAELLEHLKEELYKISRDKATLEDHNKTLVDALETLNGNYSMTRRMFEVALAKVRDLEREVATVPYLQERIGQYENQIEVKQRSGKGKVPRPKSSTLDGVLGFIRRNRHRSTSDDRHSPMGSSQNSVQSQGEPMNSGNTLEREGKQKRLSWRGSRTSNNPESETVSQLQDTFASLNSRFTKVSEEKRQLFDELQCCKLRNNECRKELENVGTDLARLGKLEEKIQDAVVLLQILRRKYLSRRTLGKFLFDVLDDCPESPRDDVMAEQFVEGLIKKLSESELLKEDYHQRVPCARRLSHPSSEDAQSLTAKERETLCFL